MTNSIPINPSYSFGKSSLKISLIIMGTAGLSACDNKNTVRYEYDDRQACVKDWGETECPPSSSNGSNGAHRSYYYYRSIYDDKRITPTHAKSIVRGGFGSSTRGGS